MNWHGVLVVLQQGRTLLSSFKTNCVLGISGSKTPGCKEHFYCSLEQLRHHRVVVLTSLIHTPDIARAVPTKNESSRDLVQYILIFQPTRLLLLLLPISTAWNSTAVQSQPEAQAILISLRLQVDTKRYLHHTIFRTAFPTVEVATFCPADCTRKRNRFCDTMDTTTNKAIWSAACCRHQNCFCFTEQVQTYLNSTLLPCRGYPSTLYATDSHTKLDLRDNPTLHQLKAFSLAKNHRNQFRGSWVTGCNHNFEIFSEAGSCYMDCKECSKKQGVAVGQP
jgi:hypothetical protein